MENFVILQLPLAWVLYGVALVLCLFDRKRKDTGGVLPLVSTAVTVLATAYVILMGATLAECAVVLMAFALLHMGVKE